MREFNTVPVQSMKLMMLQRVYSHCQFPTLVPGWAFTSPAHKLNFTVFKGFLFHPGSLLKLLALKVCCSQLDDLQITVP